MGDDVVRDTDGQPVEFHEFDPDWVVPTSVILREIIKHNHGDRRQLINAAWAVHEQRHLVDMAFRDILDRDGPVTDDRAAMLERGTGVPARFWLAFESNYRAGLAAGKTVVG